MANSQPYPYTPITERPELRLPGDARVAVYVGLNVESYAADGPGPALLPAIANRAVDPINAGWRDHGPRVGIWRLSNVLADAGITPSVLLNSDVCAAYPQIISHGRERGWCWVAHGQSNSRFAGDAPPVLDVDSERAYLTEMVSTIATATGARPRGWLGPLGLSQTPNTLALLAELGLDYCLDYTSDDLPYQLDQSELISVPYTFEINDLPLVLRGGLTGSAFAQIITDQFDVLYAEGTTVPRVLPIAVHPFVAGQAFRAGHLARALRHITDHPHVWLTTTDELADWYRDAISPPMHRS